MALVLNNFRWIKRKGRALSNLKSSYVGNAHTYRGKGENIYRYWQTSTFFA